MAAEESSLPFKEYQGEKEIDAAGLIMQSQTARLMNCASKYFEVFECLEIDRLTILFDPSQEAGYDLHLCKSGKHTTQDEGIMRLLAAVSVGTQVQLDFR